MKYRQFRILQAVSFMTNIPTYSHKGHAASTSNSRDIKYQNIGQSQTHRHSIRQTYRVKTIPRNPLRGQCSNHIITLVQSNAHEFGTFTIL